MAVEIIKLVMDRRDLKGPVKAVALVLAEHAHSDGSNAYPSVGLIAAESGYSRSTVERAIARLLELQVIAKTKNWTPRSSNRYRFFVDSVSSERQVRTDSVSSERGVRVVRVTSQSSQSDTLTVKEPLYNLLGAVQNLSDGDGEVSFSTNRLKAREARELIAAQRRAVRSGSNLVT